MEKETLDGGPMDGVVKSDEQAKFGFPIAIVIGHIAKFKKSYLPQF